MLHYVFILTYDKISISVLNSTESCNILLQKKMHNCTYILIGVVLSCTPMYVVGILLVRDKKVLKIHYNFILLTKTFYVASKIEIKIKNAMIL